ncbi:MAG: hypothetical protein ACPG5W_05605, partial [Flavobacteriales bacterium]
SPTVAVLVVVQPRESITDSELIQFFSEGENSLLNVMIRLGEVRDSEITMVDQMIGFIDTLSDPVKTALDQGTRQTFGKTLDEFEGMLRLSAKKAGKFHQTLSKFAKQLINEDVSIEMLKEQPLNDRMFHKLFGKKEGPETFQWFQDTWRRLLVSSYPTTALNFMGSATYYAGEFIVDIQEAGYQVARQLAARTPEESAHWAKRARATRLVIGNSLQRLAKPLDSIQKWRAFMSMDPKVFRQIRSVMADGVADFGSVSEILKAYNVKEDSLVWRFMMKPGEKAVDLAQLTTLVKAQDSFWKAQLFMKEMDKASIDLGFKNVEELLSKGDYFKLIDEKTKLSMAHNTLKGVFSANYGSAALASKGVIADMPTARKFADAIESISRTPGLGVAVPFGKFMANMVANAYSWTGMSLVMDTMSPSFWLRKTHAPKQRDFFRAFSSWTLLGIMYQDVENNRKEGAPPMTLPTGGGGRVSVENNYPLSYVMAAANALWEWNNNNGVLTESTKKQLGKQLAVGQLAEDFDFRGLVDALTADNASMDRELGRFVGSFIAGFTRPAQTLNTMIGEMLDNASLRDRNIYETWDEGLYHEATRYTDKILDVLSGNKLSETETKHSAAQKHGLKEENIANKVFTGAQTTPRLTNTVRMFEMAGLPSSFRPTEFSGSPLYNRFAAELIFNDLDFWAKDVVASKKFKEADIPGRRIIVDNVLEKLRKNVR